MCLSTLFALPISNARTPLRSCKFLPLLSQASISDSFKDLYIGMQTPFHGIEQIKLVHTLRALRVFDEFKIPITLFCVLKLTLTHQGTVKFSASITDRRFSPVSFTLLTILLLVIAFTKPRTKSENKHASFEQ